MKERQFFWVNHKQTAKQERGKNGSGYIWSPKTNSNGSINKTYEYLEDVKVGDIIFSYANTKIEFIGVAKSLAKEAPKPSEFGNTGDNWNQIGWRIEVDFSYKLRIPLKPKEYMDILRPLLPQKYSPIQNNGNGNQGCYLSKLSNELGFTLLSLCQAEDIIEQYPIDSIMEDTKRIEGSEEIPDTEKQQLIAARIGQGEFRKKVLELYPQCPVTDIKINCVLRASHIRPWCESSNEERLDPYNGLMLAAHVDALFDRGYISFADDGTLLLSPIAEREIEYLGIDVNRKINLYEKNITYLRWHREHVFKKNENKIRKGVF